MAGSLNDHGRPVQDAPRSYPRFWPSLTLDYLWKITEQNELHRWLVEPLRLERPVVDRHFFELLLDPVFSDYQEANHDWQTEVVHALRCFIGQTEVFTRPRHPERAAYERVLDRLRTTLPKFAEFEQRARSQIPTSASGVAGLVCEGAVVLPWSDDQLLPLAFGAIFQRDSPLGGAPRKAPYQVTLVPTTDAITVASILVYVERTGWAHQAAQASRHDQLQWGLALLETIIAGRKVRDGEPGWDALAAFQDFHRTIIGRFPTPAAELAEQFVAAIRDLWDQTNPPDRADSLAFVMKFCQQEDLSYLTRILMRRETHPLYIGSRLEHRPDKAHRLQDQLKEADAALAEELREAHPARAWNEIRATYPNQWVALLPTRVSPGLDLLEGRVFAAAPDPAPVQEQVTALRQDVPHLSVFAYFTGPSNPEGVARRG